jgi:hypothetical protein
LKNKKIAKTEIRLTIIVAVMIKNRIIS